MSTEVLRILYISHSHPPDDEPLKNLGGMQRVSMQLTRELRRRKDVELQTKILKTSWKGIALRTAGFLGELILRLPSLAGQSNIDVILFSSMVTASTSIALKRRIDIPMVTITHGQDVTLPNKGYQWLVPSIFKRMDGVISVSEATKAACVSRGMDPESVKALGNGFDMEDMDTYPEHKTARERLISELGWQVEQKPLLLTVGRLVKRKGHERFIRNILPLIRTPVKYLIIGDGPQQEAINSAIQESGLQDVVFMAGRQPDSVLQDAYAAADLFVMPNVPVEGDMEGFGIVLLEANMAATAAVASDLEGIKDVIEDGKNGYRVEVNNDQRFAQKIDDLLLKVDLHKFGEQAKQYVRSHFSWQKVAAEYVSFLRNIVNKNRAD